MKTEEEKAFWSKIDQIELEELMYDEFYDLIAEAKNIGYEEAMRWRDPKVESPEEDGLYLCKCKSHSLGFYFEVVFLNKVWQTNNIIGWRPIE